MACPQVVSLCLAAAMHFFSVRLLCNSHGSCPWIVWLLVITNMTLLCMTAPQAPSLWRAEGAAAGMARAAPHQGCVLMVICAAARKDKMLEIPYTCAARCAVLCISHASTTIHLSHGISQGHRSYSQCGSHFQECLKLPFLHRCHLPV